MHALSLSSAGMPRQVNSFTVNSRVKIFPDLKFMTFARGAPVSVSTMMDELTLMLLKTWEKHTHMSTKGEKWGFSGRLEHWVVCKLLKRKGYHLGFAFHLESVAPQRRLSRGDSCTAAGAIPGDSRGTRYGNAAQTAFMKMPGQRLFLASVNWRVVLPSPDLPAHSQRS